jgi:hypothetical protein
VWDFSYEMYYLIDKGPFRLVFSSSFNFVSVFQEMCPSNQTYQIHFRRLFLIGLCYLFILSRICCNFTSHIPDILVICDFMLTILCFLFLVRLGLNSGLCTSKSSLCCLSHTSSPFFSGYFGNGFSRTIYPGSPWASQ